jgi:hypothetical protein
MGGRTQLCDLGGYRGPLRGYRHIPAMAADIAEAILDLGEAHGRLPHAERPLWDAWADGLLAVIADDPPAGESDEAYLRRLAEAARRPVPSAFAGRAD